MYDTSIVNWTSNLLLFVQTFFLSEFNSKIEKKIGENRVITN